MVTWTDERTERLAAMWADGFSASEIAAVIGGGATKNAVIGKVHRLKLPARKEGVAVPPENRKRISARIHRAGAKNTGNGGGLAIKLKRKGKRVWNNIRRPENVRPPMHIVAPPAPVEPLNLTLMQLGADQCRFIAGEPSGGCYCGHPVEKRSLCSFHYRLVWREEPVTFKRRASERELA